MPIYDFKCNKCNSIFEKLVKHTEAEVACKDCESTDVSKVISAPRESGVVLKGEGFYKPSKSSW